MVAFSFPDHVTERLPAEERQVHDALFFPSGFMFPEGRHDLWPHRRFPLQHFEPDRDASPSLDIVELGLQFSIFVQHCREPGFDVTAPASWRSQQGLWSDLPVFAEERCEWHYPTLQLGYNVDQVAPSEVLTPEHNQPEWIGYLPNGDVACYWKLAEHLADAFDLDLTPLMSSVDGRWLVTGRGASSDALLGIGIGQAGEAGVVLDRRAEGDLGEVCQVIQTLGGHPQVFGPNPSGPTFYRIRVPVVSCEAGMNRYIDARWDALGIDFQRLTGFRFQILDTRHTRLRPLLSTERGHLIASDEFVRVLTHQLQALGSSQVGDFLPVILTP